MDFLKTQNYLKQVIENMPQGWLETTTHRLDIYDEKLAKTQFLDEFERLFNTNNFERASLNNLPTAYDYIRLGHPLSCVLEWTIAQKYNLKPQYVIGFSSTTVPILSVLRANLIKTKNTRIYYLNELPKTFDAQILKEVYCYTFELIKIANQEEISASSDTTILVADEKLNSTVLNPNIDFYVTNYPELGSILLVNGAKNESYVSEIQHVRRRETIAMTPDSCLSALKSMIDPSFSNPKSGDLEMNKSLVLNTIKEITGISTLPLVASSGLSIQYAILMGLIDDAKHNYPDKAIKIVVPPNCYGGTNDQARRIAACIENVEIVDLAVDGDNDMNESIEFVLSKIAEEDAIPYIIAEIPTNPRVEVPELQKLKELLSQERKTPNGATAIDPVFILDQTFCPNVRFLGEGEILANVRTISFSSGSKFPSGGLCTAGYCIGNSRAERLMEKIGLHLNLCDNEATPLQYEILAKQMPSMIQRIKDAYVNTREFVNFIQEVLPAAKINFVSEELASLGFTPSVFSLDLPTKGNSAEEKENYKRAMNHKLIDLMITKIPNESKYCVSYGQLKGCYWTIPATSTQGTTKEGDKDYIARVALSANMDLELHKKVFLEFVEGM